MDLGKLVKDKQIKVYRNEDLEAVIAAIPRGHYHIRLAIITKDQVIVLHEATIAGIVRAYINIAAHPLKKAIALFRKELQVRKHGYAKHQLVEEELGEDAIISFMEEILAKAYTSP